jgi:lysophospholipase L1-like esterase
VRPSLLLLILLTATSLPAAVSKRAANSDGEAMSLIKDDPTLPRVLLIGDSISVGYTKPVQSRLNGVANVHRIPGNGSSTTNGLARLDAWLGTNRWHVIHFNWGLHDLKLMPEGQHMVPLTEYEANLEKLVQRLAATGAKLIWATTTPVPEGKLTPPRKPSDVLLYNQAAARVVQRHRCLVNDLHAFASGQLDKIQLPANVHFTKEGSEKLAGQVADSIRKVLPEKKPSTPMTQ